MLFNKKVEVDYDQKIRLMQLELEDLKRKSYEKEMRDQERMAQEQEAREKALLYEKLRQEIEYEKAKLSGANGISKTPSFSYEKAIREAGAIGNAVTDTLIGNPTGAPVKYPKIGTVEPEEKEDDELVVPVRKKDKTIINKKR
jgi:hypothetical protein